MNKIRLLCIITVTSLLIPCAAPAIWSGIAEFECVVTEVSRKNKKRTVFTAVFYEYYEIRGAQLANHQSYVYKGKHHQKISKGDILDITAASSNKYGIIVKECEMLHNELELEYGTRNDNDGTKNSARKAGLNVLFCLVGFFGGVFVVWLILKTFQRDGCT